MDYKRRQRRLRASLKELGLEALLVTHLPNVRYLCGFTGSAGVLAIAEHRAAFFTDGRYTEQAKAEVSGARVLVGKGAALPGAVDWLSSAEVRNLGFEADHVTFAGRQELTKLFRKQGMAGRVRLRSTSGLVEKLRMQKDAAELEQIRSAVMLASSIFPKIIEKLQPGTSEGRIAAEIEYACRCSGAEGMAFDTLVSSGLRSALPHGVASGHPIEKRGFVILDYGVIVSGYCSDMTRTIHAGPIDGRSRSIYDAVLQAQLAAIDTVKEGVEAGVVDAAAREVLERSKLARYFTHSTGHGLGLEIHESPRIAKRQGELLKSGMVITIEPGVYIPGLGGVRIEDTVRVTPSGCEVLTPTAKDLITI